MTVEIYTKATCGYCARAKMLLDQKKVSYREIAIDHDASLREEMIARSKGGYTVPQIFINDTPIGGCDELFHLHNQNRLDALLNNSV
jgi:glutaredoxin 3